MIRNFLTVLDGAIARHDSAEVAAALVARGATVIEISPALACALVRIYELDDNGERIMEIG